MKKLLLVGAVAGAIVGARKLREGVRQNGGLTATRRRAVRKARHLAKQTNPKIQQAAAAAVAEAAEVLRKRTIDSPGHKQTTAEAAN